MTDTCWPRETLKRYLSGAIDAELTGSIEAHLAACAQCEQTIVELEGEPDTWLGSLRELENATSQGKSRLTDSPAVIQSAVAAARD